MTAKARAKRKRALRATAKQAAPPSPGSYTVTATGTSGICKECHRPIAEGQSYFLSGGEIYHQPCLQLVIGRDGHPDLPAHLEKINAPDFPYKGVAALMERLPGQSNHNRPRVATRRATG